MPVGSGAAAASAAAGLLKDAAGKWQIIHHGFIDINSLSSNIDTWRNVPLSRMYTRSPEWVTTTFSDAGRLEDMFGPLGKKMLNHPAVLGGRQDAH